MSTSVPPILQLAATLNLLASGSFQHNAGNDFLIGLAQSTMCKVVKKVTKEIEKKLCAKMINFLPNQSEECMEYFMDKFKIPGVVGCVDGTHFGFQAPTENEYMFFNRKGFHSLNSMIICDHEYKILAINSMYGGVAHDSFVWKHCEERRLLEQLYTENGLNVWVLGDSGYPTEPWCIVPYSITAEGYAEAYFNEIHAKARCIVERTIGILKGRWRILCNERRSRYSPEKMAIFGNVCGALHNVCIKFKVPMYTQVNSREPSSIEVFTGGETRLLKIGQKIRDQIKIPLNANI
ncbi:putative nuclease HARBI1 [Calliphora vicina]|uniref:putative nuclease HARBI1 n=1 Tax=Calliphora vicina TaxID=7373 RepID=UPI00325A68C5